MKTKETHPSSLLHRTVSVAIQTGENGTSRHHLISVIPAMSVAESRRITLTFLIEDWVQPDEQHSDHVLLLPHLRNICCTNCVSTDEDILQLYDHEMNLNIY